MTELSASPRRRRSGRTSRSACSTLITPQLVDPSDPRAVRLRGTLLDGAGEPVPDGMIEIWQANAAGRYAHPLDDRTELELEDGFSASVAPARPRRPVRVRDGQAGPGPVAQGGLQAPHLEVGVFARGLLKRAVTRIYFPDEAEANAADPVLSRLGEESRATLVAAAEDGGLRFDIRLQGPGQTAFFAV